MQEYFQTLEAMTSMSKSSIEKVISSTPPLKDGFKKNKHLISSIHDVFISSNLSPTQFAVLFATAPSNFASPGKITDLAKVFERSFKISRETAIIQSAKTPNLYDTSLQSLEFEIKNLFSKLNLSAFEACNVVRHHPLLLSQIQTVNSNIDYLANVQNLKFENIYKIFINSPKLFFMKDLPKRIAKAKTILDLSAAELSDFLTSYPKLLFVSTKQMNETIECLAKEFYLSDFEIVSMMRSFPKLILISANSIKQFSKTLMQSAMMSTSDIKNIIKSTPRLIRLNPKSLAEKIQQLHSSELFVKLDIKRLITLCPSVLETKMKQLAENILDLSRIFDLASKKDICKFLRECPELVASSSLKSKLVSLDNQEITLAVLESIPSLLSENQNILSVKNTILVPFDLSYHLDSAKDIDYTVLISRLKFLGLCGHNTSDITLSESEFQKIYSMTDQEVLERFPVSSQEIKNLINVPYLTSSAKCMLAKMFKSDFIKELKIVSNIMQKSNTKRSTETIQAILETLGLERHSAKEIANNAPTFIAPNTIVSITELLSKCGIPREQIIKIIQKNPCTLFSPINKLRLLLEENKVFIQKNKLKLSTMI